jgi:hypothetical protein
VSLEESRTSKREVITWDKLTILYCEALVAYSSSIIWLTENILYSYDFASSQVINSTTVLAVPKDSSKLQVPKSAC